MRSSQPERTFWLTISCIFFELLQKKKTGRVQRLLPCTAHNCLLLTWSLYRRIAARRHVENRRATLAPVGRLYSNSSATQSHSYWESFVNEPSLLLARTSGFRDNTKRSFFFNFFYYWEIPQSSYESEPQNADGNSLPPVVRQRCCGCQVVENPLRRPNSVSINGSVATLQPAPTMRAVASSRNNKPQSMASEIFSRSDVQEQTKTEKRRRWVHDRFFLTTV